MYMILNYTRRIHDQPDRKCFHLPPDSASVPPNIVLFFFGLLLGEVVSELLTGTLMVLLVRLRLIFLSFFGSMILVCLVTMELVLHLVEERFFACVSTIVRCQSKAGRNPQRSYLRTCCCRCRVLLLVG